MKHITVIGAGLSGTLLMINLLKQRWPNPVIITWIDRRDVNDLGPAYSTNEDYLLNVPAQMMGAFANDPEHFLKWCGERNVPARTGDYLPRKLYREYIQAVLNEAWHDKDWNLYIERIADDAADIEIESEGLKIYLERSGYIHTDEVVLALGNSLPSHPSLDDDSFINHPRYIQDPWDPGLLDRISKPDDLFFIGTGQTMTDLITGLHKRDHTGRLMAISRRGILPMVHKTYDPYPSFYNELEGLSDILAVFKVVRKHLKIAEESGIDPRAVIDSIRPHSINIWMSLPTEEKKRFLRHIFRYWEVIRSRIPPSSGQVIDELLGSGQLGILKGRITGIHKQADMLTISYLDKDSKHEITEKARFVINCMGPNLDYDKIEGGLIRNLITKGIIHSDPAHLGIDALPDGTVLESDGQPSDRIFTVGPTLKGIVWEALATPEIRVQAESLARKLKDMKHQYLYSAI